MNPAATAWAATAAGSAPKRFAFVGFPHGAIMDRWSPKADRHRLRDVADPRAADAVPRAPDDRLGVAQQAGRNAGAARLYRVDVAELREAVGPRRRRPGRRRHRRPDGGAAHRAGDAAAVARADDVAGRRATGLADADAAAAAGRQSARGVSEAVRPGRHRQGTRGDSPRNRQHSRPRQGTGRAAAGQPRRPRPRRRQRLPGLGPRDRAARADGVAAGHHVAATFRMRRSARRTTSPSISS